MMEDKEYFRDCFKNNDYLFINNKKEIFLCKQWKEGRKLMREIAERLEYARKNHTKEEWQRMNVIDAFNALQEEINEVKFAVEHEGEQRMQDELLDVIAVAVRMLNHEYGE